MVASGLFMGKSLPGRRGLQVIPVRGAFALILDTAMTLHAGKYVVQHKLASFMRVSSVFSALNRITKSRDLRFHGIDHRYGRTRRIRPQETQHAATDTSITITLFNT